MSPRQDVGSGVVIAERFEVERLAGEGGMGSVFRARDRLSGRAVAVKMLHRDAGQHLPRLLREAAVLAELEHPAIVRYVAHGTTSDGELYLAMEWLEGESLRTRLEREGLGVGAALALVRRVAEALGVAHRRGIIHRDLKPSNLFLVDGELGQVKVLDFGIARLRGRGLELTVAGSVLGTPGYMAPEQVRSDPDVDARADVFALGCLLFKCLAGRGPFVGDDDMAVLLKALLEDAPRLGSLRSDVPLELDSLLADMLAKSPSDRPADGAAVAQRIAALGELDGAAAERVSAEPAAITNTERRVMCVVLSRVRPASAETEETVVFADRDELEQAIRKTARRHGASPDVLADGSILVTLVSAGAATDLATRAARCALALRTLLPDSPMVLCTGLGEASLMLPVGDVTDRAARALRELSQSPPRTGAAEAMPIRLDAVTAGLLDGSFAVTAGPDGPELEREQERATPVRTLLGRPSPCVGRDRELGMLVDTFEQCAEEHVSRSVLVTAPAGVGKSRLRYELLRRLRDRSEPAEVWVARGDPMSEGAPFGMLGQAIRGAAGLLEGESAAACAEKLRAFASGSSAGADLERRVEFLGELVGAPVASGSVALEAARQDPMLMGDQMRRAFIELVASRAAARPLLFVLEDLHWGDLPTVKFVDDALRALPDRPWMVLALARPEVEEAFPGLFRDRQVTELRLPALARRAAEKLVRGSLGAAATDALVAAIVDRAAGNAFYLEELIRAVSEGRGDDLPETVLAMVQARLEHLEPEARRVLRAASVFGQVFWRGGVLALLGGPRGAPELDGVLEILARRELVTERAQGKFEGERELVFRHAIVRDAAYTMLTDHDRTLGHRLAGAWLEAAGEKQALVVAEHFERGGEPERAIRSYRGAAEQALEGNDFAAATTRAEKGVACGARGELLGELLLVQADAAMWRADQPAAERCALEAARHLARGSDFWCAAIASAVRASCRLGHTELLVATTEDLCEVAAAGGGGPPLAIALAQAGVQILYSGKNELGARVMGELERVEHGLVGEAPAARAWIRRVRGYRALHGGDPGEYLRFSAEATAMFDQAGDARTACSLGIATGYAHIRLGLYVEAETRLRQVLERASAMGLPTAVTLAKHNLGMALARRGRLDEALAFEGEAVDESVAQRDQRIESGARGYLAQIHELAGDFEAAVREARRSFDASTPPGQVNALGIIASVRLREGRAAEALDEARRALQMLEELDGIEEGEALVRLVHAEALHAVGDTAAAALAIERARSRLLERAAKIGDPAWRKSFLEAIPENARTLELGAAWGPG